MYTYRLCVGWVYTYATCDLFLPTEREIGEDECPLLLQTGATQLLLRKKLPLHTLPTLPQTESHNSPDHHSPPSTSSPGHTSSSLSLQRNWLSFHQDLITALSYFTAALQGSGEDAAATPQNSREKILEQSLVQQNQIVEMLQKTVTSLEQANTSAKEKISSLEHRVHGLRLWKARARLAEDRLKELVESTGVLGSSSAGVISLSAISSFERALTEKDKTIASLKSQVEEGGEGTEQQGSSLTAMSTKTKLAAERVRVMELEEELLLSREDSSKAHRELADCQSDIMKKESEIQYLRHEMEAVKKVGHQQQDVVMGLRAALLDRDAQISSLTRALEMTTSERDRKMARTFESTSQNMFDMLLGRDVFTVELSRDAAESELGLSISRFETPISSRISCLIVRAVKEGSSAQGLLAPGDELLEVNGLNCRNASQKRAIEVLERGTGKIKIVAARETGPADFVCRLRSTPVVSETSGSTLWATANDASFTPISPSDTSPSHPASPSSPQHYLLSLPKSPSSAPPVDIPLASHTRPQPIGQVKRLECASPDKPVAGQRASDEGASEVLEEVQRLREEAHQWQSLQAELEEELDTAHSELDAMKMENQLTVAENFDLQQQVKSSATELAEIQGQVEELQQLLEGLRDKVVREEERAHGLEQQNATLQRTVMEANAARDLEKQRASEADEKVLQLRMTSERDMSQLSTKIATLQSHNEQLESDVKQRATQLEAVQAQARECEGKLETERKEWHQQIQQLRGDLQTLREQSVRMESSSHIEAEKLQNQLATTKRLLVAAEKKEAEMKIEIRQLRQVANESNKQLEELHLSYRTLKEQESALREQAESKTLECESLTLGLKRAEGKLQANKDMSSRQQNEIDNLRRKHKELLYKRVEADEKCMKAEVELKNCRSEYAKTREKDQNQMFSDLESLVAENLTLTQQLESAQENLKEANKEKELDELHQQLEQLQKDLDKTHETLREISGLKEGLESELLLERSRTAQLQVSLSAAEASVEGSEAGKRRSDDLVASMSFVHEQDQARIKELEDSLATAQEELQKVQVEVTAVEKEKNTEVQQLEAECASLKERIQGLATQLEDERAARINEVETMKERLCASDQNASRLQMELEAQESANSINHATISQLQTASEQAEEEKAKVLKNLQDTLQRSHQLQMEIDQLQSHSRQLEMDNVSLHNERERLSESSADLKSSLQQATARVDTLTARLEVAEVNQALSQQSLEEAAVKERGLKGSVSELEGRLHECEKNLEKTQSRAQKVTLSLHTREEEVSQLKTQMELSQSELHQLQSSFTLLQGTSKSQDKRVKSLEMERDDLKTSLEQLKAAQDGLKGIITSLEREKAHSSQQQLLEVESLTQQLKEKSDTEKEQLVKIKQLERQYSEAQSTAEGLLAAQDALRHSLSELGDEKEGEVVRLRDQLVTLECNLVTSQQHLSQAKNREEQLQIQLLEATESGGVAAEGLSLLQEENDHLKEEVEELRATEAQLKELHCKIDSLEEGQKEKNRQLVAMQAELSDTTRQLHSARTENKALLERVGEVAEMTLSVVEKTAELEKVKGELAAEVKGRQEVVNEKEQLLAVLRRLEVEKHTAAVVAQPNPPLALQEADREKLLQAARAKEEEAQRLREYVGKLLSAVVEKAPFVLERME